MKIASIWQYPVKSFIGHTVASAEFNELGMIGDRVWAIRDLEKNSIRGAKKIPALMQFAARRIDEAKSGESGGHAPAIVITLPDGSTVRSDAPDVDAVLSRALDRRVHLDALRPASDTAHFLRGAPDAASPEAELRSIMGREPDEPLPDYTVFPSVLARYESPPGTYYDCWPLMLMTTSALRSIQAALPGSNADILRFRPSIVIDTGDAPGHPEFAWKGRIARIGSTQIEFLDPCPRCSMTTRAVNADIPEDQGILRYIVRELDQNLGIYAVIRSAGRINVGDRMEFVTN